MELNSFKSLLETFLQFRAMADATDLTSVDDGVGKFFYSGGEISLNLWPLVAAIIVGILRNDFLKHNYQILLV